MSKLLLLVFLLPVRLNAQHVVTSDLGHFWQALDSIRSVKDTNMQVDFINRLYIDKGSEGLQAFLRNKEGVDKQLVGLIKHDPIFWDSIRIKSAKLKEVIPRIEEEIQKYQSLYPALKPSKIFFLVGIKQQGGTIRNNFSLIGTEVILGNPSYTTTDDWINLCLHEYTHTQQKRADFQKIDVLTSSIREGACDFIAEFITKKPIKAIYMDYGNAHEAAVFRLFKKEMFTRKSDNWVSTGENPDLPAPDLGYYVGYRICKNYYDKNIDKREALRVIIELDYANPITIQEFLKQSGLLEDK